MRLTAWILPSAMTFAVLALGVSAALTSAEAAPGKGPPAGKGKNKDTTPPVINCPTSVAANTLSESGATVWFYVSVTDNKDPAPVYTVEPPSGSTFALGATTVTVTATDAHGNTATKSFEVTVTRMSLPKSYKAYWTDSASNAYFEWDITIAEDGTVEGSGQQTQLLVDYDGFTKYADVLPDGLSGSGTVSGTLASDGSIALESSSSYATWLVGDVDSGGNPVYTQATAGFSGTVFPWVDGAGNLSFSEDVLGEPYAAYYWYYDYGDFWSVQ
jgi:hypothetical protein